MKKFFTYVLAAGLMLSSPMLVFSSCGDDDPADNSNGGDDSGVVVPNDRALTSYEQKQKLESIAKELMNKVPSSDFNDLTNLASYVKQHYVENDAFDHSAVTDWFDDLIDGCTDFVSHKTENHYGWYEDVTYYNRLITLSNFTGHFTAGSNKWSYSKANDLQFEFTDENGQQCVLSIKQEGNVKKAYITDEDDWYDYNYEGNNSIEYINRYKYYVNVPERVVVTLTQGGATRVSSVTKIDISQFNGPEYDLSRDGVDLTTTNTVNDYTWTVERAAFSGTKGTASLKGYMKKGDTVMFSIDASGEGLKLTSDDELKEAGTVKVNVDVLGKMQIKATCSNPKELSRLLDKANQNDEDQRTFESCIAQANSLIDCTVYYDGKSVEQAKVKFEAFKESGYYSYYYYEPALFFNDNSSYAVSFDDYFDETSFKSVIDMFEDLLRGYERLGDKLSD